MNKYPHSMLKNAEVGDKILSSLDKDIHNNFFAFFT